MEDIIYFGGPILTMEPGPDPEAVLVREGRIKALGSLEKCIALAPHAQRLDLDGRALLPAFLDSHSHITSLAGTLGLCDLSAAQSFDEIAAALRAFLDADPPAPGGWVCGFGYDHNFLREKQHPTRRLLDQVSADIPILISNTSGHMGVANSAALRAMGITAGTPDPEGGMIGRESGGREPNGYLEETAFTALGSLAPRPTMQQRISQLCRAEEVYLSHGITTIQDGLTRDADWALLQAASQQGSLRADIVSYIDLQHCRDLATDEPRLKQYRGHLKLGGYKIFLDGSPQGRTAWMSRPYLCADDGYRGYPVHSDAAVEAFMTAALEDDTQILVHCNGDAAAQQMLDAYAAAVKKTGRGGIRPVMIHAQLLREDQLPQLAELGIFASFFVAHTWQWGDVHIENFGMPRASRISPAGSALRAGVPYTFHQDTPVLPPDMIDTLFCAVNRLTRSGVRLDQNERVSVLDALRGVTINAAAQYFEEGEKGSIAPGKRADLILLSEDPRAVPAEELRRIRVLETFKDGVSVWRA